MGVLEPRDQLRFGLEPADEFWLASEMGENDLDRDFPVNAALERAVNRAKTASGNLLAYFIALKDSS